MASMRGRDPGAGAPAVPLTKDQLEEHLDDALIIGVKKGAELVKWIPWPWAPERQWVAIRACTVGEVDNAYLYAVQKCIELKMPGDEILFKRWEKIALLSSAIRDSLAIQQGESCELVYKKKKYEEPAFTSPQHLKDSLRDEEMLEYLWSCYCEHCKTSAPLSTAKKLMQQHRFAEVVAILKKKHGPIDLDDLLLTELPILLGYLLTLLPSAPDDSPA